MPKTKKPTMTEEEARAILPRRVDRWKVISRAAVVLAAKAKPVEKDIRDAVDVLPNKEWEGRGVRAKRVNTKPVKKKDEENIAMVLKEVKQEHLDIVAPRMIDIEALEPLYPELYKKLKRANKSRFELDLVQKHIER